MTDKSTAPSRRSITSFADDDDIPLPTPKQLELLGEPFHPYRSIVAWYCWRAASLTADQTPQPPSG